MKELDDSENNKKQWKCPEIVLLETKKTNSGETYDTPENLGYDPVIS